MAIAVTMSYDAARGRVRIDASSFATGVTSARVSWRRVAGGGQWATVRGGVVPVASNIMVRPADDYEFPAGEDITYLVEGLTDAGVVVESAQVARSAVGDRVWLKIVASPASNRPVTLTGWSPIRRQSRSATYDVEGRSDPVVVSGVHSSRTVTVVLVTHSHEETEALDAALKLGQPVFLQVPKGVGLPTLYASVGDFEHVPLSTRSARSRWTLPLVEVAPPPPSVHGAFETWQTVLDQYATWADLLAAKATWREVAA